MLSPVPAIKDVRRSEYCDQRDHETSENGLISAGLLQPFPIW
jgi:hypothetical protein